MFGCAIQLARSLVPQPAIEPAPLAVKTRSPNQWTKREFPEPLFTASSKQKNLTSPAESSHISYHPPLLKILPTSCYPKNQVLSSEWERGTEGQRDRDSQGQPGVQVHSCPAAESQGRRCPSPQPGSHLLLGQPLPLAELVPAPKPFAHTNTPGDSRVGHTEEPLTGRG